MKSKIIYYPVDNGDQSLVSIVENNSTTNILVDCKIRETSIGNDNPEQFDVKSDLLKQLGKKSVNGIANVTYADVFILTHGDDDHLHGFEKHFYQVSPNDFKQKHKDAGEIFIDVLWFSPTVMGTATNEDEEVFNKEAKRRIKLHQDKDPARHLPGNRIVIIGYDGNEDLDGLDLVRKVPGNIVSRFNDKELQTFSVFIHSPYQKGLSDEEVDKNRVSVVFQARFKSSAYTTDFCTLAMFGGDANHEAWAEILDKTKRYGNDRKEQALKWDLFMACHHCSWTFFNNCPQAENPVPKASSLEVLRNQRTGAKVIASSKEIIDNDDNPPHYKAKQQYVKVVGDANFLNTATAIKSGKTPQPIVFEITQQGPMKPKLSEGSAVATGTAGLQSVSSVSKYGSGAI
jgi:hypothetical protein